MFVVNIIWLAVCGEGLGLAVCGKGLGLAVCGEGLELAVWKGVGLVFMST